ncbi:MAG: ArnT family glycosyltransferase [Bacteroidota bacterium]
MNRLAEKIRTAFIRLDDRKLRILFYTFWLTLNLIQALFTNLLYDEAYYWVISGEPDWGHFYSPPLIDLLIRAGYRLFHNELGVRLFFVLLGTSGIWLTEKLLVVKDLKLYYALLLSMVFFQVTGIIAAPDIPLFFLSTTFYLLFRRFLRQPGWINSLLLALNTSLLLFTKYHGILLIGFTFIWNIPYLVRQRQTIVWVVFSILLFFPHILWQIRNGFPTLVFHLFERPGGGLFEWKNILDYIPGQLLFAGPLISIPLFLSLIRLKRENRMEQTMFFNLLAMYGFFFLVSLTNHVEINWTVIGIVPLVVLSQKALSEQEKLRKWIFRLLPYSLLLALIFRILLIFPHLVPGSRLDEELYGYHNWAEQIKEEASGRPVVFMERYQRTSAYAFYSGDSLTYTLNPTQKSDFDLMDMEERIQGKTVLFVSRYHITGDMDTLLTKKGTWYTKEIPNFRSYKKFRFEITGLGDLSSDTLSLFLHPVNPAGTRISFAENSEMPAQIGYRLYQNGSLVFENANLIAATLLAGGGKLELPLQGAEPGEYEVQIILKSGWLPAYPVSRLFHFLH